MPAELDLRDFFAAKAMQGICASDAMEWRDFNESGPAIASAAYLIADAMLAQRQRDGAE